MDFLTSFSDVIIDNITLLVPVIAIFTRLSVFIYLLPGLGETVIPQRIRLGAAFLITWILVPILVPTIALPELTLPTGTLLIAKEGFHGFALGFAFRMMIFVLHMLGNIVSQALSISQVLGEGIATEPNTTISTLLMMSGVTLLVTMDLHVEAIGVFYRSYDIFPLGSAPNMDNIAYWMTQKAMGAIGFAVTLALPFIILNFVYNLMLGFLNRAMPQLMVSFVGMPAITGAGLFLLVIASGSILVFWAQAYHGSLDGFYGLSSSEAVQ
ncbi:flagellar biosynthetic protein FliR [Hellea sp.]|nr:flagellar biosynthetic protein FliR [Hellea sp.]